MADHQTAENKDKFLVAYEQKAGNVSQACEAIGIARQTFYEWCHKDDIFNTRQQEVKDTLVDFAEATLLTLIKEKNPTATIFFLKTQGKHRGYVE